MKKDSREAIQKTMYISGLSCAHCAAKILEAVERLPGLQSAHLDFVSGKLHLCLEPGAEEQLILQSVQDTAHQIEEGLYFFEDKKETNFRIASENWKERIKQHRMPMIRILLATLLLLSAVSFEWEGVGGIATIFIAYLLAGGDVLWRALQNIRKAAFMDEYFLMSVATLGAFAIGEYAEGVAVMIFYQTGELFQSMAVEHARQEIRSLLSMRPDYAHQKHNGDFVRVSPDTVSVGDSIWVKPGERVPLDGEVLSGNTFMDTSALTGEAKPKSVGPGDTVLSGMMNSSGLIELRVTQPYGESTLSKILASVEHASAKKAKTERFMTSFARYYTPIVVYLAVAMALLPPLLIDQSFMDWVYRALVFLVLSCPCGLVLSIPLGFFGGLGAASARGILFKGGNYLEALGDIKVAVFDKTGTLTQGNFAVSHIYPAAGVSEDTVLKKAYLAEKNSEHPIALSIVRKARERHLHHDTAHRDRHQRTSKKDMFTNNALNFASFTEVPGKGVILHREGEKIIVGNAALLRDQGIVVEAYDVADTMVYVGVGDKFLGAIQIADTAKEGVETLAGELKAAGIEKIVMLTGDHARVATALGSKLGIDMVFAGLLPHEKVEKLEALQNEGKKVLFVGDGINDAPVLARADIGVAMGGLGREAAIEAADVVIMQDDPRKLMEGIRISRFTKKIVWQNIIFSLGIKVIVLLLGAGGMATLWEAVFADVGVAVLAVLNAIRVFKQNKGDGQKFRRRSPL